MHTYDLKRFSKDYYDYTLDDKPLTNYRVRWACSTVAFNTCGPRKKRVHALKFNKHTVRIEIIENNKIVQTFNYKDFKEKYPNIPLDLKYNCHGWAFTNGYYLLMDMYIPDILKDEYTEVKGTEQHDIIVFKSKINGNWIHSARKEKVGYSHKNWIKEFTHVKWASEIQKMKEYMNTDIHYFRKNNRECNYCCLRMENETRISLTKD